MFENEKEFIQNQVRHLLEALAFFSNPNKTKREIITVTAFLRSIGEAFSQNELLVGTDEPIDVSFRTARFQVTEMIGDRRRMDEFRQRLRRAQHAKRIRDLMEPWPSSKPSSLEQTVHFVSCHLARKANRYPPVVRAELDALVYVNWGGRHLWPLAPPSNGALSKLLGQTWRSASILFPPYGIVLSAHPDAPDFLKAKVGKILQCTNPDGCFGAA
jgi:hypothetical protein